MSAAHFHFLRTGIHQKVTVDARHATLEFCQYLVVIDEYMTLMWSTDSEMLYTVNGGLPDGSVWDAIAGVYETKDGSFVRIHTNFPQSVSLFLTHVLSSPLTLVLQSPPRDSRHSRVPTNERISAGGSTSVERCGLRNGSRISKYVRHGVQIF